MKTPVILAWVGSGKQSLPEIKGIQDDICITPKKGERIIFTNEASNRNQDIAVETPYDPMKGKTSSPEIARRKKGKVFPGPETVEKSRVGQ